MAQTTTGAAPAASEPQAPEEAARTRRPSADPHAAAEAMLRCGSVLLRSGCQVRTVEDTAVALGSTFEGVESCSAYVTLTGVIVCVSTPEGDATKIARIDDVGHDLWAVGETMRLAKSCAKHPCSPQVALERLEDIEDGPQNGTALTAAAYAVGAMGCVIFYGSTGPFWLTMLFVALGALLVYFMSWLTDRLLPNAYVGIIVQSAAATAACALFHRFFPATDLGSMLIPILMLLVPGLTFTSSIMDTLSGDYLSGNARLVIALLVGVSIAIGTAVVLHYTGVLTWQLS